MRHPRPLALLALALFLLLSPSAVGAQTSTLDYDVLGGHFFTQTNGSPIGTAMTGFAVTNEASIPFWDEYKRLGGPTVLGYPVTKRFVYDGFITQAMQKVVFQWRPEVGAVYFLNTFDALHDKGKDDWLLNFRQTPLPFDTSPDAGLSWEQVVSRHQAMLDQNQAIKAVYFADSDPIAHYGLPVSYADMGNSFVIRAQRATFQYWKENVPWAKQGEVSVANGGDLAKEIGLWPLDAATPGFAPLRPVVLIPGTPGVVASATPTATSGATATATPGVTATGTPTATSFPAATATPSYVPPAPNGPGVYRAKSPEYGMNIFVWGNPATTGRDLGKLRDSGFGWHKTLFQWRAIEGAGKGIFDWREADRVVKASADAGIKLIARVDFQPGWARADRAHNGPPDNYRDLTDFIFALVDRYKTGSPYGRIHAVEIWNEPNLSREWGDKAPDPAAYVALLKAGYEGAKRADPTVAVITAGLTPTGTWNDEAWPDDIFLQKMYDAGAKAYFDILGAHGAGYKAPPSMGPDQVASDPSYGGHRFFTFRRVEDLRAVMVRNGDSAKQIWLLEFGWTSDTIHPAYAWHAVTEEQKAAYIVEAYRWALGNWTPWVGVMTLWNLPDPAWNLDREEYWWAIANQDGTDRPAYTKLKEARATGYLP